MDNNTRLTSLCMEAGMAEGVRHGGWCAVRAVASLSAAFAVSLAFCAYGEGDYAEMPGVLQPKNPGGAAGQTPGQGGGYAEMPGELQPKNPGGAAGQTPGQGGGYAEMPGELQPKNPGGAAGQTPGQGGGYAEMPGELQPKNPGGAAGQTPGQGGDSEVRRRIVNSLEETQRTLRQKEAAGTITPDERELLESLNRAAASLDGMSDAELEALAALVSNGGSSVVPVEGGRPGALTPADIARAQEEARRMSAAAEEFNNSEAGKSPEGTARQESTGGRSRSGGGSGSVWSSGGGSGGRRVTADVAIDGSAGEYGFDGMAFSTNAIDAVDFGILNWDFGGFEPKTNCYRTVVEIAELDVGRNGLSFRYIQDLSSWGLGYEDYSGALACLFVCDGDGRWVGGKFDWISSSRDQRDFANIYEGYEGWSLSNVPNPCPVAFVIVSPDGKRRSNVISSVWER